MESLDKEETLTLEAKCHVRMLAAELAFLDGDQESSLTSLALDPDQLDMLPAPLRVTIFDNRLLAELMAPGAHVMTRADGTWTRMRASARQRSSTAISSTPGAQREAGNTTKPSRNFARTSSTRTGKETGACSGTRRMR